MRSASSLRSEVNIRPIGSAGAAAEAGDVGHIPHVYVAPPWSGAHIHPSDAACRHLRKVMRLGDGSPISYTDGRGRTGTGTFADDEITRGDEADVPAALPAIVLAVAPPQSTDRARFVVEKAAELAVTELRWLVTRFGGGRIPRRDKAEAWAIGALEQSRGAHLMRIGTELDVAELAMLDVDLALVADHGAPPIRQALGGHDPAKVAIAIGPEGGFAAGEVPDGPTHVGLGARILRVETAAVVAAGAFRIG
jgi:16S rRNA (uracil1498-N3)-methyltransferase